MRVNGVLEVEDLVGHHRRRLVVVALQSGLRQRPDDPAALVVDVLADVHVLLLVLGRSEILMS